MPKTGGEGDAWNFCSSPGNALESPVFLEHLERHCFEMQVSISLSISLRSKRILRYTGSNLCIVTTLLSYYYTL